MIIIPEVNLGSLLSSFSYCEEIPVEENEVNDSSSKSSIETKPDASPQLPKKSITNSTLTSTGSSEAPVSVWAWTHSPSTQGLGSCRVVNATGTLFWGVTGDRVVIPWLGYSTTHPGKGAVYIPVM